MAKRFDAALKRLVEAYPGDWLAYFLGQFGGGSAGPVEVIDSDIATVTAAADKVFRVREPRPWLLHLELQSSPDERLPQHMLLYNVLLHEKHGLPVRSGVLLLRPEANRRNVTGLVRREWPEGRRYMEFRYAVVRLWEQPPEPLLTGGLGLLPLAPLADVEPEQLPALVGRMEQRLEREAARAEAERLRVTTYVLLGLRYPLDFARQLLPGVRAMEESVTYQAIVAEGEVKGIRKVVLSLGTKKFGPPDAGTRQALEDVTDLESLERIALRVEESSSWADLVARPRPRRRSRRRTNP